MSQRPLDGLLVVDFTTMVAGPWCTRLLADCGAEVIKVEPVGDGDVIRYAPPVAEGMSRVFAHFNCGKQSLSLNLKSPAGLEIARNLIERADIVVENFRPGVMKRFGLDYESVKETNPKLIYCAVSGFGQTGPLSDKAAYAPVVHAYSGFDHILAKVQGGDGTPLASGIMIADVVAAAYAFGAIQTAVVQRERHGAGSLVDVTLIESVMSLIAIQCQEAQSTHPISSWVSRPIKSRDGHVIIPLVSVKNFVGIYHVIGKSDWATNPDFASLDGVRRNGDTIMAAISGWVGTHNGSECEEILAAAGIPCSTYRTPAEILTDAHLNERGSFGHLEDADGPFTVLNPPFKFSPTPCEALPFVARPGEHTEQIMSQILGLSEAAIDRYRMDNAFAVKETEK